MPPEIQQFYPRSLKSSHPWFPGEVIPDSEEERELFHHHDSENPTKLTLRSNAPRPGPRKKPQIQITESTDDDADPDVNEISDSSFEMESMLSESTSEPSEKPRRNTKKAQQELEQKKLHTYAQKVFKDLNEQVFSRGLPEDTILCWNKRLTKTAGRAHYHRSREGIQTTEIELAEKILDCEERIRNTLSHEMCHLATWIIDEKPDEKHGKLFKYWASRITTECPEIQVLVRHEYEISYPFNWECQKCAQRYGRFSKSIRPELCRCGACKHVDGILVPLFTTTREPCNTSRLKQMAAVSKCQDLLPASQAPHDQVNVNKDSDADHDVQAITEILELTMIKA